MYKHENNLQTCKGTEKRSNLTTSMRNHTRPNHRGLNSRVIPLPPPILEVRESTREWDVGTCVPPSAPFIIISGESEAVEVIFDLT